MLRSQKMHPITQRRQVRAARVGHRSRWLLLCLPVALWAGQGAMRSYLQPPQAILVLGGSTAAMEREKFAADFAHEHPNLPILISSGSPKEPTEWVFADAGVSLDRLNLDYRAVDTVTNFTTIADDLKAQGIKKIYLITSDFHMRRARMIGQIVLGSRGIDLQTVPVPSEQPEESIAKVLRDSGRAVLWVTTGHTGANLHPVADQQ
jgi:uncharacterized SAM-binding protein YcdF (DUF218 family)